MALPVVDPPFERVATAREPEVDPRLGGVVLAAGDSDRFGSADKLVATLDGEPLVRRATAPLAATLATTVVVAREGRGGAIGDALGDLDATVVENPDADAGRATSVAAGLEALLERVDTEFDGVVVALGDVPRVDRRTVELLVEAHRAGVGTALAAGYEGRRGNPVLFDATHFEALRELTGETGGRQVLLAAEDAAIVETGDPGVLRDVDAPADLDALRDAGGGGAVDER